MRTRTLLTIILALFILLALCGCNPKTNMNNGSDDSVSNTEMISTTDPDLTSETEPTETIISGQDSFMDTLQKFFDGFNNNNSKHLKEVFYPVASHAYQNNDNNFESSNLPINSWINIVTQTSWDEFDIEVILIDITGDTAAAYVEWRQTDIIFEDYYTALCVDGSWKLTTKTFGTGTPGINRAESPDESEKAKILETLQMFYDAYDDNDIKLLNKAIFPSARIFSNHFTNDYGKQDLTLDEYVSQNQDNRQCERELIFLDMTKNVAVAKVEWRYSDATLTYYYTIMRIARSWRITNAVFN